ncbi:5'-nucleotidase C-terminal domain-containing protein [Myxococcota bacterium]|nr:5'-nucleotidase C-terminal domain-containing protein [Myxococcota bacterium]
MKSHALEALLLATLALTACAPDAGLDPDADAAETESESQTVVLEWSPEACAVLAVANTASLEVLDDDVRLDKRAAENIVAYRAGATADASDDRTFGTIAELDAVRYVSTSALRKLLAYGSANGFACSFPPLALQLLNVSDWHGQLDPVAVTGVGNVGGAAALAAYFARDRAANPNTLVLTAGDAFGATPPLASFFEERPAVLAMNDMGFDADGIGNHNFDRGVAHLEQMARLARFPYVSANLRNVDDNLSCPDKPEGRCVVPYQLFELGGVEVAVIGVTNDDAQLLSRPGNLGTIEVTSSIVGAIRARAEAEAAGAEVFVLICHMGATGFVDGQPVGPLIDFANALEGFDVVLGDHTNVQVNTVINGALVVENRSAGVTYARTTVLFDRWTREVTSRTAELVTPLADVITPDATVLATLAPFRTQLSAAYDATIATTNEILLRGANAERLREMPIGNLVADSMRVRYGTQLALTNGGGIRAPLPSSYAPADTSLRRPAAGYQTGTPYDLVVGDVFAVLPFGNVVVTRTVSGRQLWAALEHAVEALPNANGWFAQVSGIRFVFDSTKPVGTRITSITLDDGTPILADDTRYSLATSDFIDAGGDGYTMLAGGDGISRDKMADVLLDHVRALGTLSNTTDGRILDQLRP